MLIVMVRFRRCWAAASNRPVVKEKDPFGRVYIRPSRLYIHGIISAIWYGVPFIPLFFLRGVTSLQPRYGCLIRLLYYLITARCCKRTVTGRDGSQESVLYPTDGRQQHQPRRFEKPQLFRWHPDKMEHEECCAKKSLLDVR